MISELEIEAFNAFDKLRDSQGGENFIEWNGEHYNIDSWQAQYVFVIAQDEHQLAILNEYLTTI